MFSLRTSLRRQIIRPVLCALRAKHTLPKLPYPYESLEPHISADIMKTHHTKHHATYVNNLNAAEEKLQAATTAGVYV